MIEPMRMPDFSHVAIFRNECGAVTWRAFLMLPLASDGDANMTASGMKRANDAYVDVFEIHGAHRTGGWKFRVEGAL